MPDNKRKPSVSKPRKMTPNRRGAEGPKRMGGRAARSAKAISGDYRGSKQPRRRPVKTASGLQKAMKNTQRGRTAWN